MAQYAKYSDLGEKEVQLNGPELLHVKSTEHKQQLIKSHQVCVVDVYADWCGPCKAVAPKYRELAQKHGAQGKCILVKEDADNEFDFSDAPPLRGLPTFQFFRNGVFVDQVVGADIGQVETKLTGLLQ